MTKRDPIRNNRDWLFGPILFLAVVLAYQPVWQAGFIWDDGIILTANPCIVGPLGLKEIWTTNSAQFYPLTLTTLWLEHALWGLWPLPYHLVNVLLHGACAILLWRVLRSLRVPGAWLGAAFWALHPLQVESVAWVAELKNTQSCLFYLLSILFFVKGLQNKNGWNYGLTLLFAALAMSSKSSTVILPIVLCLCAWWVEGRWRWRNLGQVAPIFLLSVVAALVTIWTRDFNPDLIRSWPQRLATAGDVVWFYLGKLLWPHPLMTIYPRWKIDAGQGLSYLPLLGLLILLFILWLKRGTWSRPYFFALAYFLVALLPVMGLVNHHIFSHSIVFDHLQYLAGMGPLALAGAGLVRLADCAILERRRLQAVLYAGLLLILGLLSWQRVWVYKSQKTLWTDALAGNPDSWVAHYNLGRALSQKGQVDEALTQYQKALAIDPDDAEACNNLGYALLQKGRVDEAMAQFQKALAIDPNSAEAYNNFGYALSQKGQVDEAIAQYQKALAIDPNSAEARDNLGNIFFQKGRLDEALTQYQKALTINSNFAEARDNLGLVFFHKGQVDEAIAQYRKALEINSGFAEAHNNLGAALAQKGRLDEALAQFQKAVEIQPDYGLAHDNLGFALFQKGRTQEALAEYQRALQINPDDAEARYGLGFALAKMGRWDEAMTEYQKAIDLKPGFAEAHDSLGIAFFQKGQPEKAMTEFEKAIQLEPGYGNAQSNLAKVKAMMRVKAAQK